jgi:hypothetical protein
MAETASGIRQKGIDLASSRCGIELVDAFGRRKIGLNCFDFGTAVTKRGRRLLDLTFVSRDQQIVTLVCTENLNSDVVTIKSAKDRI